ncbi:Rieske iron-sulfur domain protein [Candidatus Micropelagos thuwalensis]|uniref:Rieske iron-sulfur domain protein n=1 Tax=Candidatus Micropelagius thuwalensis TaxID=1397666 RepID=U2WUE6_9PROT|nr:TonB-dependent receptor [Candidatus Micropelagos thuwalensis]ERL47170.1 Rieske iron-sulfur domain protein [Candidatus Micropelagos thuwalensis]
MSNKLYMSSLAVALITSGVSFSGPVNAQESRAIDNIVVTAQKREESLQEVPVSISAFDVEALDNRDIDGFADLSQFTPGLVTYPAAANSNGFRIFMRGIGTGDPQHGLDSKVAMYVDGMYMGKIIGIAFDSPDLARAEVLKGPQGSLYGRNAVAGAINLISAKPNPDEYFGKIEAGFGSFGQRELQGYVNIPLDDSSAIRLSAYHSEHDGWVENKGLGENFAASDKVGYRFSYLNEVNDSLTVNFSADYGEMENTPLYYQSVPDGTYQPAQVSQFGFEGVVTPRFGRQDTANSLQNVGRGTMENMGVSLTVEYDIADNHKVKFNAGFRSQDGERAVSLQPDVGQIDALSVGSGPYLGDVVPGVSLGLNAITGGYVFNQQSGGGLMTLGLNNPLFLNGTVANNGFVPFRPDFYAALSAPMTDFYNSLSTGPDDHEQTQFEITFTGDVMDGKLEYTAGLYYLNEDTATNRDIDGGYASRTDASAFADLGTLLGACTPALYGGNQAAFVQGCTTAAARTRRGSGLPLIVDTDAMAAYSQLTYHVQDNLRITAGIRVSDEEKDVIQQPHSPLMVDNRDLLGNIIPTNIASTSFDSTDPTFMIEYDFNDDTMLYVSRTESFRAGGFNETAGSLPENTTDAQGNFILARCNPGETGPRRSYGCDLVFDPEEITAYEIGIKSTFNDGRTRLNIAAFQYELDNEQFNVPKEPLVATNRAIVNTTAEMEGFEFDFVHLIGDSFTISGNAAYTDVQNDPVVNPYLCQLTPTFQQQIALCPPGTPLVVDLREDPLGVPEWQYSVSLDYNTQINDRLEMYAHINLNHKDDHLSSQDEGNDAHDLINANIRFNYELSNGKSAFLKFWGKNITDEEYRIDGIGFRALSYDVFVFGEPASYGVSMGMNF